MKHVAGPLTGRLLAGAAAAALAAGLAHAQQQTAQSRGGPRIEVAFVLDTTGSMSGLIDGAKRKIWSIASEMLETEEQAEIAFGLIGYRDRGDDYVTKVYDLTPDINGVYGHLLEFEADGGGDRPESVNQALSEAVTQLRWSDNPRTLRLVFLVGDSPPNDYKDDVDYDRTCVLARDRRIRVNTILAGGALDTGAVWNDIAQRCNGAYMEIPQDGGVQQITTPLDGQITDLQQKINRTVTPYGAREKQAEVYAKQADVAAAPAEAASDMAAVRMKAGKINRVITGGADLVEDYEDGKVDLAKVKSEELPDELKALSTDELKAKVEGRVAERKALNAEMSDLVEKRDAWVKDEMERRAREKGGDGFDTEVAKTVRAQAAEAGIAYKD